MSYGELKPKDLEQHCGILRIIIDYADIAADCANLIRKMCEHMSGRVLHDAAMQHVLCLLQYQASGEVTAG